jgi:hypothetical protein
MALFADRLPEKHRAAAWSQAYDNYSKLWKQQGPEIEKLPIHQKGAVSRARNQSFFAGGFAASTILRSNAPVLSTKNTQSAALSQDVVCR